MYGYIELVFFLIFSLNQPYTLAGFFFTRNFIEQSIIIEQSQLTLNKEINNNISNVSFSESASLLAQDYTETAYFGDDYVGTKTVLL